MRGLARHRWLWAVVLFLAAGTSVLAANTDALMRQGMSLYQKEKYAKALRVFLKARNLDPANLEAREYVNRCTDKIVEEEAGKKLKARSRSTQTSSATIEAGQPVPKWAAPSRKARVAPVRPPRRTATGSKTTGGSGSSGTQGSVWLIRQGELADEYRRKIMGDSPVLVETSGSRTDVVLHFNRLFLPYKDTLSPDAVPFLAAAAATVRSREGKTVLLRAVDTMTPAIRHRLLDLPSRRCAVIFTYFVDAGLSPDASSSSTYKADDLDD